MKVRDRCYSYSRDKRRFFPGRRGKWLIFFISFIVVGIGGDTPVVKGKEKIVGKKPTLYRNPFLSLLPKKISPEKRLPDKKAEVDGVELEIRIEGLLWGGKRPQAIIEGEIYDVGEKLKNKDMKIISIKKGRIEILYQGKVYPLTVKKRLDR